MSGEAEENAPLPNPDEAKSPLMSKMESLPREELIKFLKKQIFLNQKTKAKCEELTKEIESMKTNENTSENVISSDQWECMKLKQESMAAAYQTTVEELKGAFEKNKELERRLEEGRGEIDEVRNANAKLLQDVHDQRNSGGQLEERLADWEKMMKMLEKERDDSRDHLEEVRGALRAGADVVDGIIRVVEPAAPDRDVVSEINSDRVSPFLQNDADASEERELVDASSEILQLEDHLMKRLNYLNSLTGSLVFERDEIKERIQHFISDTLQLDARSRFDASEAEDVVDSSASLLEMMDRIEESVRIMKEDLSSKASLIVRVLDGDEVEAGCEFQAGVDASTDRVQETVIFSRRGSLVVLNESSATQNLESVALRDSSHQVCLHDTSLRMSLLKEDILGLLREREDLLMKISGHEADVQSSNFTVDQLKSLETQVKKLKLELETTSALFAERLQDKQQEVEEMTKELSLREEKIRALERRVDDVPSEVMKLEVRVSELQAKIKILEIKVQDKDSVLLEKEEELSGRLTELEASAALEALKDLETTKQMLEEKIVKYEDVLSESYRRMEALEAENISLISDRESLVEEKLLVIGEKEREMTSLLLDVENLKSRLEESLSSSRELDRVKSLLLEKDALLESRGRELDVLNGDLVETTKQLEVASEKICLMETREAEVVGLLERVASLESAAGNREEDVPSESLLREAMQKLELENCSLSRKLQEATLKIESVFEEKTFEKLTLRESVDDLSSELEEVRQKFESHLDSRMASELESIRAELHSTRTELVASCANLDALNSEMDAINLELERERQTSQDSTAESELARSTLSSKEAELLSVRSELESLKSELEGLRSSERSIQSGLNEALMAHQADRIELERIEYIFGTTKEELASTKLELESANSELESARLELDSAKSESEGNRVRLECELKSVRSEFENSKCEMELVQAELKSALLDADLSRKDLQTARETVEAEKISTAEDFEKLEKELMLEREKLHALEKKLEFHEEQMLDSKRKSRDIESETAGREFHEDEVSGLKLQLKEKEDRETKMKQLLLKTKKEIADLKKKLDDSTLELNQVKQSSTNRKASDQSTSMLYQNLQGEYEKLEALFDAEKTINLQLRGVTDQLATELGQSKLRVAEAAENEVNLKGEIEMREKIIEAFEEVKLQADKEVHAEKIQRDALNKEKIMLESKLSSLEIQLRQTKEEHQSDVRKLEEKVKVKIGELENARKDAQHSQLVSLEIADYEKTVKLLNFALEEKEVKVRSLQEEMQHVQQQRDATTKLLETCEKQFKQSEEHSGKLKQLVVKLKKDLSDARKQEGELSSSETQLRTQNEMLQRLTEEQKLKIAHLTSENSQVSGRLATASEAQQRTNQLLEAKLVNQQKELELSRQASDKLQNDYDGYKVRVHSVLKQKASKVFDETALLEEKKERERLEQVNNQLKAKIVDLSNQLSLATAEGEQMREENEKLLQRQSQLMSNFDLVEGAWKEKLEKLTNNHAAEHARQVETIQQLMMQNEDMTQTFKEQHACVVESLKNQLDKAQLEVDRCRTRLQSLNPSPTSATSGQPTNAVLNKSAPVDSLHEERQAAEGEEHSEEQQQTRALHSNPSLPPARLSFVPLEVLLSGNSLASSEAADEDTAKDERDELNPLKEALATSQRQGAHMRQLLNESEANVLRLSEQAGILKSEIRRLERNQERQSSVSNMEYLKNIVYKFLTLKSGEERMQLIPVMQTMLKFSQEEREKVISIAAGIDPTSTAGRDASGWSSYIKWSGLV